MIKRKLIPLLLLIFCILPEAKAQQVQEELKTKSIFVYPQFKDAKIRFIFGRKGTAKANISYKNSKLVYMQDSTVMTAFLHDVLRVEFDDAVYLKVDSFMAKVEGELDGNYLVSVTEVDREKLFGEEAKGENLPYFDAPDFGLFIDLHADERPEANSYPLKRLYYFVKKGVKIEAKQGSFKKYVKSEQKKEFREIVENRFWSWKDKKSLLDLLKFL